MRLICPNCGAQYEVPDQVIPPEGRDVQCSNCGHTWFQDHPAHPRPDLPEDEEEAVVWEEEDAAPDGPEEAEFEPEPDDGAEAWPEDTGPEAEPERPPPAREASVTDVLREEAEREARLRAQENAAGLESQPDLGLESSGGDAHRRAAEARARMARLRGERVDTPEAAPETESRRGLLPDIEEINSGFKSSDKAVTTATAPALPPRAQRKRSGGFSRGFAIAILIAAILFLVYTNAPRISEAVPAADPALNAYVAFVDNARIWLDRQLGTLIPPQ